MHNDEAKWLAMALCNQAIEFQTETDQRVFIIGLKTVRMICLIEERDNTDPVQCEFVKAFRLEIERNIANK